MPHRSSVGLSRRQRWGLALLLASAAALLSAAPALAREFVDAARRRVTLPPVVERVLPAERNAEVLTFALAPQKLAGLSARPMLLRPARRPVLEWGLRSTPASMAATARQVGADLILDAGPVTPERAAFADQVQQLSGIPYVLVDDSFARMPAMLRSLGLLLGVNERADDLGLYAEHAIAGLRGRLLIAAADTRPRVYYALGANGLTTALPGSPAGEAIEEAGAINVAAALGRGGEAAVSPAQLAAWNPEIIIAERRSFYDALRRNPGWRRLAAVRSQHVYLEPTSPYGWIEDPSGINRLIGLYWLSKLLYPDATQDDLRATTCEFYDKFYRIKLTNAQIEGLVGPAGAAPIEARRPMSEPLVGLGAAPSSSLPSSTPGAAKTPPATLPPVAPAPARSGAPSSAPAEAGVGAIPSGVEGGPNDKCTIPGGPSPLAMPETLPAPGTTPLEGVPPPGRRGRPVQGLPGLPGLNEPSANPR